MKRITKENFNFSTLNLSTKYKRISICFFWATTSWNMVNNFTKSVFTTCSRARISTFVS